MYLVKWTLGWGLYTPQVNPYGIMDSTSHSMESILLDLAVRRAQCQGGNDNYDVIT